MLSFPFDYDLPADLIAQEPQEPRDDSRLLVLRRGERTVSHHRFRDLPNLLAAGDLLVLNDTRVLHARLLGRRERTGGKWEGLFLKALADGSWEMLCQTGGKPQPGECVIAGSGDLKITLEEKLGDGRWRVRPEATGTPADILQRHGQVPLPPYIHRGRARPGDEARYQTVYARHAGSVAAPTAGLHFTPAVFDALRDRGLDVAWVTLHVGLGTFQPIQVDDYRLHTMHAEWGQLGPETAQALDRCKRRRGRVIAVGTTSVRVLESAARVGPGPWSGETNLFIHPPYTFAQVDGLVTNFHLPRTTLLLLVAALAGVESLKIAYQTAIEERYRFYSYGDAMLIL